MFGRNSWRRRWWSDSIGGEVAVKRSCCQRPYPLSILTLFFFSSRRRHTRYWRDWIQTCALPISLPAMRIDFTKMHGVGNDFVVFDAPADESLLAPGLLRRLGERRTGIGFDQALVLERPRREGTAVFYRIFNRDGDEVEQCGNGARCVAALLKQRGLAPGGSLTLDSPSGVVQARIDGGLGVSVDMGVPDFDP